MKLEDMTRAAGMSAGVEVMAKTMRPLDIMFNPELDIFEIDEDLVKSITQSIRDKGYDKAEPIVIWKGEGCVVDGRTRLKAALAAELSEIPVVEKEFDTLEDAIQYAFRRQADRRNLTQGEILEAAIRLGIKDHRDGTGRGSEQLAKNLGVSSSTIEHARTVAKRASGEDLDAIKKGEKSINEVYQGIKKTKEEDESAKSDGGDMVSFSEFMADWDGEKENSGTGDQMEVEDPLADNIGLDPLDDIKGFDTETLDEEDGDGEGPVDAMSLHPSPAVDNIIERFGEASGEGAIGVDIGDEDDGSETDSEDGEKPDYADIGDSVQIKMLKSIIILLHENKQFDCINLLINHFILRKKRSLFLKLFTKELRDSLETCPSSR
jgi:ParB-like chromosome segregation protein Spo0J